MLILPVAAFCGNQVPAIGFNEFDSVADFHNQILAHKALPDPLNLQLGTHEV